MTDEEQKRDAQLSLACGFMYGTLRKVAQHGEAGATIRRIVENDIAFVKPLIAGLYRQPVNAWTLFSDNELAALATNSEAALRKKIETEVLRREKLANLTTVAKDGEP